MGVKKHELAEAKMTRIYEDHEELGHAPILLKREIVRNPWTEVRNGTAAKYKAEREAKSR